MWNLLSIVREMFKRNDRNSIPLLEIITEECLATEKVGKHHSVLVFPVHLLATPLHSLAKVSSCYSVFISCQCPVSGSSFEVVFKMVLVCAGSSVRLMVVVVVSPDPGVVGQHQGCPSHGQLWPWWEEQHELQQSR